ncbi:sensor histidine kinase [Demequina aurantiaca]|uniref:sensor histidine kinase n=1 Tax=Demequina aurantiaca TaxID=676200 RepID=UPI000781E481|nr:HAMP domain-containing sensor histidine kinase [Demequina aurantiaca]
MTFPGTGTPARLSLRTRVLIGFSAIAAIAVLVACVVTATTHSFLVRQLDDRLASFAGAAPLGGNQEQRPQLPAGGPGDENSRPSDVLRAWVDPSGEVTVFFAPNVGDEDSGAPILDVDDLPTQGNTYLNAPSTAGGDDFRVYARATPRGWDITALSLADVSSATQRLVLIETIGIAAMLAGLGLVAWWVIRLGIAPMRRMVDASSRIAEGDLDVRLDGAGGSTETAQLADSLNAMIGTLTASLTERERSEARLREFVADASHELRTPITTILGYSELYRRGALSKKADAADAWSRTEAEAGRMRRLVADMLELAKYDAEPVLNRVDVDLEALASEVVADASTAHPDNSFRVDATGSVHTHGDADKLRQALINVVANAAEHGGTNVTVTVTAATGGAQLAVSDDGPGMTPSVAARATERFVRGDHSRTRATGGAGLGLAITSAIVEAHGGTLTVESGEGSGTSVTMNFID